MKYNREKLRNQIEMLTYSERSIQKSIKLNCPYSDIQIKGKDRQAELVTWRSAIAVIFWVHGDTLEQAGKRVNRNHDSIIHYIRNVQGEIFTCHFKIVDKIRLITYYANRFDKEFNNCNEVEFVIKKIEDAHNKNVEQEIEKYMLNTEK